MFSKEFFELLLQVIKSWQVLAVTAGLIIYIYIVSHAASSYRRPRVKKDKTKRVKTNASTEDTGPEETIESGNTNDELGLEEA